MAEYIASNGTIYTDEDIERWAEEAEAGWPGVQFGPPTPGPLTFPGAKPRPFPIRLYYRIRFLRARRMIRKMNATESQEERN